jgi:uncharacterized protein YjdB
MSIARSVPWCLAACLASACSGSTGLDRSGAAAVASVVVDPASSTLVVGTEAPLHATAQDESGRALPDATIVWTVRDSTIARVSATGVVSALAVGNTQVAANANGRFAIATIAVRAVPVGSVAVAPTTVSVVLGQTVTIVPTVRDANGVVVTNRVVTWSSSNAAVAAVSAAGVVTGVAQGSATITATSEGQSASSVVSVTPPAPVPVASFIYTCASLACAFVNTSTNATSYSWSFGDGTPAATTTNATHTYAKAGTYQVTLAAQRGALSSTAKLSLTVTTR